MRDPQICLDMRTLTGPALICRSWRNEAVLALITDILLSSIERRNYSRSLALSILRPVRGSAFGELSYMRAG